jgi:hypothetical protein
MKLPLQSEDDWVLGCWAGPNLGARGGFVARQRWDLERVYSDLVVRASESTIVSAKLCVPTGSPDQLSAGEMFYPLQLPSTRANAIGLPLLTFVEDTMNYAGAGVAAANAAPKISARNLPSLLLAGLRRHRARAPVD